MSLLDLKSGTPRVRVRCRPAPHAISVVSGQSVPDSIAA
jgi:hypothetical protein